jgi:hypothetical protein
MFSSFLPPSVTALFFVGHGPRSHGVSFAVGKIDDNCEKISSGVGLSENIVNRIVAL